MGMSDVWLLVSDAVHDLWDLWWRGPVFFVWFMVLVQGGAWGAGALTVAALYVLEAICLPLWRAFARPVVSAAKYTDDFYEVDDGPGGASCG